MSDREAEVESEDELYTLDFPELRRKVKQHPEGGKVFQTTGEDARLEGGSNTVAEQGTAGENGIATTVYHEGNADFVPISRTPSPEPPPELSDEQMEFEAVVRAAHRSRIVHERQAHEDRMARLRANLARNQNKDAEENVRDLATKRLQVRGKALDDASVEILIGNPRRLPFPWTFQHRRALIHFPDLLGEYLDQEAKVEYLLDKCLKDTQRLIEVEQRLDPELFDINDSLNDLKALRKREEESGYDEMVLSELLDCIQARRDALGKEAWDLTDLHVAISIAIQRHPQLKERLEYMIHDGYSGGLQMQSGEKRIWGGDEQGTGFSAPPTRPWHKRSRH